MEVSPYCDAALHPSSRSRCHVRPNCDLGARPSVRDAQCGAAPTLPIRSRAVSDADGEHGRSSCRCTPIVRDGDVRSWRGDGRLRCPAPADHVRTAPPAGGAGQATSILQRRTGRAVPRVAGYTRTTGSVSTSSRCLISGGAGEVGRREVRFLRMHTDSRL